MQVVIATIGRCNHLILYLRSTIVIIIWQETKTFRNYWSINNTQQLAQLCNPTAKGSSKVPGLFRFFWACIFVSPVPGPRDWNPTDSLLGITIVQQNGTQKSSNFGRCFFLEMTWFPWGFPVKFWGLHWAFRSSPQPLWHQLAQEPMRTKWHGLIDTSCEPNGNGMASLSMDQNGGYHGMSINPPFLYFD